MIILNGRSAPRSVSLRQISCQVCMKEIPYSEVVNEEATDYVIYYFGLDCFDTWRHLAEDSINIHIWH